MTTMTKPAVELGDVFYRSWGYDQTNVNFYQVVGFTPSGKSMRLREVAKTVESYTNSVGRISHGVVPVKDAWRDREIVTKRIQVIGEHAYAAWNSYSSLSKHNGTPKYDTCALGYEGH